MSKTFNIGDSVTLKSGGPRMTIEYIDEDTGSADCVWFVKQDLKRATFAAGTLAPYATPPASGSGFVGSY